MSDDPRPVSVVTGATSGIGLATAAALARRGGTVVVGGRSIERARERAGWISTLAPGTHVVPMGADLELQSEVRPFASAIAARFDRIDLLVNDAGAIFAGHHRTVEGHERTWALNVLAPFLLTRLLLDRLRAAAPSRVVMVASAAHRGARLDLDDPERVGGYRAYGRSKLALILLTGEFARRLDARAVTVNAVHPGFVASRFGHNNPGLLGGGLRLAEALFGISPESGARTPLFASTSPALAQVSGEYFARSRVARPSSAARDEATARRLWEVCSRQTGEPVDL